MVRPFAAGPAASRRQVLSWWGGARAAGASATVTEVLAAGDRVLVGLRVSRGQDRGGDEVVDRWQVLTLRDGLVADIRGYDEREDAASAAGLG